MVSELRLSWLLTGTAAVSPITVTVTVTVTVIKSSPWQLEVYPAVQCTEAWGLTPNCDSPNCNST